jgi:hypothetical protein
VQKDLLMTYENPLFAQAELRTVRGSTIERNKMSTKTLRKRISLVAVAALGAGVISVAPASAAATQYALTGLSTTLTTAVGSAVSTTIRLTTTGVPTDTAVVTDTLTLVSKPGDSSVALNTSATHAATKATLTTAASGDATYGNAVGATAGQIVKTTVAVATVAASNLTVGTFAITPDKPGVYQYKITPVVSVADAGATTADSAVTITIYAGYSGADTVNVNTAFMTQGAAITTSATAVAGGLATVRVTNFEDTAADAYYNVAVTGGTLTAVAGSANIDKDAADNAGFNLANGSSLAGGINFYVDSAATVSDYVDLQVSSATAGTVTITVTGFNSSTGIGTVHSAPSVTFGAASSTDATAAKSTIYAVATHNTQATVASAALVAVSKTAGTDAAAFSVVVNDGYGNPISGDIVSATVSGPGLIIGAAGTNGTATPNARVATATTNSSGQVYFNLDADGTAGVSTITFAVGTTTLGTKTVSFYGSAAKYTASTVLNAIPGTATTDAVVVSAVDAAGIAIPSATIYAFSSDVTIASVETSDTTATTAAAEANIGDPAAYVAAKAIGTAGFTVTPVAGTLKDSVTITFGNASTIALSTVTTTAVVKIGGVMASTVTLTTDKATYAPGEKMVLTLTFKDSLGRLTGTNVGTTVVGAFTSSSSLGGETLWVAGAQATKLGVATKTVYAPLASGSITVTGVTGTDAAYLATAATKLAVTATANVSANTETAALTLLINSLIKKINALSTLVAKIQKKLGVK